MPKQDKNAKNMPGHASRNKGGKLRKRRGDTQLKTLEKQYGVKFKERNDMRLDSFKEKHSIDSVNKALDIARKNKKK
jgi:hypothetical protein